MRHTDGALSYWIFTPGAEVHRPSLNVLKRYGTSSQQTYAYSLVDHLNWAHANGKTPDSLTLEDLQRYMNGVTGEAGGVYGIAWRDPDQKPLGASAAGNVATIVKAYYVSLSASEKVNSDLVSALTSGGAVRRGVRSRSAGEANPLAPTKSSRRPRFLPDEVVEALFQPDVLTTARDVMIVTWLHDGGLRVGGLCGLRFCDLHLVRHHPCGQRADPHIHIIGRDDNPNGARAKTYAAPRDNLSSDGYVVDGIIRAVSPDMISTFHAYLLDEYHPVQHLVDHELVLIHGQGPTPGAAMTTAAVRKMLRRACDRAGLSVRVTPHAFRHKAAAAFYAASDFNAEMVAQEFGWANPEMVTDLYGKSANRHALKYLREAWEATARPPSEPYLALCEDELTEEEVR
ncbi:tyrosine-type recombinase/integrase [Mycolicibacterium fluoranthenivorans]|uniref:tyrosine-type recombinase/integrase n=1 Tax=Mycolicibacterium fluoranthenivorans TaxID=258505 RepID=UPI001F187CE3|nr:tyrosine-type recombinase/integrase [Mycolicibacterium fluoranthenivorans]